MATKNKKQISPYQTTWLCIRKEYIYIDARRGARGLNLSKKVEKELKKRGFAKLNKYYCKPYHNLLHLSIDRLSLQAFISRNEEIAYRHLVRLFYISDKQFGNCYDLNLYSVTTKHQKEKALIVRNNEL